MEGTLAAAPAFFPVYHSHTVDHLHSIKGTDFYAVSKAKAAAVADLRTAGRNKGEHFTVTCSAVIIILFCFFTSTGTVYKSGHPSGLFRFFSKNSRNFGSRLISAHRTGIDRSFFCNDRSGTSIAACKTTAAAVISRQCFPHRRFLSSLHMEKPVGDPENRPRRSPVPPTRQVATMIPDISSPPSYFSPEKPKNAIAIRQAVRSTMGVPLKDSGISLSSIFSRIPAMSTIAMKNPMAVASPYTTPSRML